MYNVPNVHAYNIHVYYFGACFPKSMTQVLTCTLANNLYQALPFLPPKSPDIIPSVLTVATAS